MQKNARAPSTPKLTKAEQREINRLEHRRLQAARDNKPIPPMEVKTPTTVDEFIALAEEGIAKRIAAGDTTAIIFTLKTLGRKRGWVEHAPLEEIEMTAFKQLKEFFESTSQEPEMIPELEIAARADPDLCKEKTKRPC